MGEGADLKSENLGSSLISTLPNFITWGETSSSPVPQLPHGKMKMLPRSLGRGGHDPPARSEVRRERTEIRLFENYYSPQPNTRNLEKIRIV